MRRFVFSRSSRVHHKRILGFVFMIMIGEARGANECAVWFSKHDVSEQVLPINSTLTEIKSRISREPKGL